MSQNKANGSDLTNRYSHFGGGNLTSFNISGDLDINGGVISGERILGYVGGNLTITSPQDMSTYSSSQTSMSAGASIGWNLNTWSPRGGVNASVSLQGVKSKYVSVGDEQAGIKAGDGGFYITVDGATRLNGAVISSSQAAVDQGLNYLSTNGLWITDLRNSSSYKATNTSISAGYSPNGGMGNFSGGMPLVMSSTGNSQGLTRSGISGGVILNNGQLTFVDSAGRPINTSVRTGDASGKIDNIFSQEKIDAEFALGTNLSQQAGIFLSNKAQDAKTAKEQKEEELKKGADADPKKIEQLVAAQKDAEAWAPGTTNRLLFTAVTSAFTGNMSGTAAQALQSAVVTSIQGLGANVVKGIADSYEKDAGKVPGETLRAALQAIVGCAGAAASGGDCGSAALGASASVVVNDLIDYAAKTKASDLSAVDKETRLNLVTTLLAGVSTALGGDAAATALAARVEAENNNLAVISRMPILIVGSIVAAYPTLVQWIKKLVEDPFYAKPNNSNPPPSDAYDPKGPKAPGKPVGVEDFADPKGGEQWVKDPNGGGYGWLDSKGRVWVPSGPQEGSRHGPPHWDVQDKDGNHRNIGPNTMNGANK